MAPDDVLDRRAVRIDGWVALAPYALLIAPVLASWPSSDALGDRHLVTLGLAAVSALWMLLGPRPDSGRVRVGVHCVGLVLLVAALSARDPWFAGLFGLVGHIQLWHMLRSPWRYIGVVTTAAVTVPSYIGGFPPSGPRETALYLLFTGIVSLMVVLFCSLGEVTAEQNAQRKTVITRLAEANARLTETIRENDELHARLLDQARRTGVHDERRRLAEEIHDTLAQGLAGILTQVEAARRAEDHPADRTRHLEIAARLARDNLVEARRAVHAEGPAVLESTRLPEAVTRVVDQWRTTHDGTAAAATTTGTVRPLPADVDLVLVRAAQESLANVAKHAAASRVGITLSYMEDEVRLDVRDDGVGFGPGGTTNGGFGLTAMRQRAERLGGALDVESEPGAGTTVSLSLPVGPWAAAPGA